MRELVACLREDRAPLASSSHDLHLLDVIARIIAERMSASLEALFGSEAPPGARALAL